MAKRRTLARVMTSWDIRTYDVWGNAKDGFEVNDVFSSGSVELELIVERHNIGTSQEFASAYPSDSQLKHALGVRCHIETDGDDLTIYVNRSRDNYPLGELHCTSHASLSPIRAKE